MQALFGITRPSAGTRRRSTASRSRSRRPADAIAAGIVYVPEERQRQGVVLALPIFQNITLPSLGRTRAARLPRPCPANSRLPAAMPTRLDLRAASLEPGGRHAVGRQPAEGRDRQVAGHRAARHHPRRADQGHRRRLEGRRPRLHGRTRRAGPRGHHGVVGDCRKSSACPTASSSCARAASPASSTRAGLTRRDAGRAPPPATSAAEAA